MEVENGPHTLRLLSFKKTGVNSTSMVVSGSVFSLCGSMREEAQVTFNLEESSATSKWPVAMKQQKRPLARK